MTRFFYWILKEEIIQKTAQLGIDEEQVKDVLSRVHRKTEKEMEGSYALLKEMLSFFIEKNYSIWKTNNELKKTPANQDRVLSQITQIMYSYNLTLNSISGKYSLIVGTGMEAFVKIFESTDDYETAYRQKIQYVTKNYINAFDKIIVWKFFWSVVQRYRRLPEEDKATSAYPYPHLLFQEKHRSVQQM